MNNLELVRRINGAGNMREGIGIRASSTTLSSNNLASFYYSRGRYSKRAAILMGARAMQEGIGSNLCNFSRISLDLKFAGLNSKLGAVGEVVNRRLPLDLKFGGAEIRC